MPKLPALPYTNNGTKISVTKFGGIDRTAADGALYDALNMSADNYPYISTRRGFAAVQMKDEAGNYFYSFDIEIKAAQQLADGSGVIFLGDSKAYIYTFEDGVARELSYGRTVEISSESVVSFIRTREISATDENGDRVTYEYTYYITMILSARYALITSVRKTKDNSDNVISGSSVTRKYAVALGSKWEATSEAYQADETFYSSVRDISTVFADRRGGYNADGQERTPDVSNFHPISLGTGQTVLSSVNASLLDVAAPGLYLKVKHPGENKPRNGLVTDVFMQHGITLTAMEQPINCIYYKDDGGNFERATGTFMYSHVYEIQDSGTDKEYAVSGHTAAVSGTPFLAVLCTADPHDESVTTSYIHDVTQYWYKPSGTDADYAYIRIPSSSFTWNDTQHDTVYLIVSAWQNQQTKVVEIADNDMSKTVLSGMAASSFDKPWYTWNSIVFEGNAGFERNNIRAGTVFFAPAAGDYSIALGDVPPNIRGAFVAYNRMWAYDDYTIYASALGRYEDFTVDKTDEGGWSVGLAGKTLITAGIAYGGRPMFFTEHSIITIFGSVPSNFSLRINDSWGVSYGSAASLRLCGGYLFYLSPLGIMRYGGNEPVCVSTGLTRRQLVNGRAESDGRFYFMYARDAEENRESALDLLPSDYLYIYDLYTDTWHKAQYKGDATMPSLVAGKARLTDPLFCYVQYEPQNVSHVLMVNKQETPSTPGAYKFFIYAIPTQDRQALIKGALPHLGYFGYNDSYHWAVRTGNYYLQSPNVKTIKTIHLRARLLSYPHMEGAELKVLICYDNADASLDEREIEDITGFEEVFELIVPQPKYPNNVSKYEGEEYADRNIFIPLAPRRCITFKLQICGTARWEISDLSFEYELSSERR